MNETYVYEIRVRGELSPDWSDWLSGLTICSDTQGETVLRGLLIDQAALFGVLTKLHALNLGLISVSRFGA